MERIKYMIFSILCVGILTACASKKAGCDAYGKNELQPLTNKEVAK